MERKGPRLPPMELGHGVKKLARALAYKLFNPFLPPLRGE